MYDYGINLNPPWENSLLMKTRALIDTYSEHCQYNLTENYYLIISNFQSVYRALALR